MMGMAPSSGPIFLCLVTLWGHHSIFKREAHFRSEETLRRSDLPKVHSNFIYLLIFLFTPILIVKLRLIPKHPGSGPGHQAQVALGGR